MADGGLIAIKIVFIVVIYVLAFVSGILPNIIPWCKKSTNFLGIANAFSGGVFIAIAFMHILPEASGDYLEYMEENENEQMSLTHGDDDDDDDPFPLPFVLTFVGYAFILLIDKVIFDTHSLLGDHQHGHGHAIDTEHKDMSKKHLLEEDVRESFSRNGKFSSKMHQALYPAGKEGDEINESSRKSHDKLDDEAHASEHLITKADIEQPQEKGCVSSLTPVVLMIALSTHAVFEGIATGMVDDSHDIWTYIIAILLHKWAAAMSLGISMNKNFKDDKKIMYLLLFIFSFATPVGVGIGMGIANSNAITEIIFSSLAAGTFVYIACSEVIVEEFSIPKYKWIKMLAFLLGAALILCLGFIES
ncbi:unnamed protein product [Moneuplotes crassus]|uniref:Uncharacterized protein n=2 Tax=Euplotes crassus TaxID=5936 RepID=A0AAD1XIA1_EUPCR|nr:unnamed protein product [Moneuplotes crassus]